MDNVSEDLYWILAYYYFTPIKDPMQEVNLHKAFFDKHDVMCRIYISEQGINGQMSTSPAVANAYMAWMHDRSEFQQLTFKKQAYHEHVFPRMTIKYRKHLVAFDESVDLSKRGQHVSPEQWKNMMEQRDNCILLDVRNEYEWKVGHFNGAELPKCETFREFSEYADKLKETVDHQKTPVMMYCTGGIRCELYSSILMEKGFENVYQLDGGVINYGQKQGNSHWLGKLFVFDDRLAVPICEEESPVVGTCHHCQKPDDHYYNCANMDCNSLFLCCPNCLQQYAGCCQSDCMKVQNLRPFHQQNAHKPFRRWYHYKNDLPEKAAVKLGCKKRRK